MSSGAREEETWAEVVCAIESKMKVAAQEWRRMIDLKELLQSSWAMVFATALLQAVLRHVPEQDRRTAIALDFQGLMHRPDLDDHQRPE